MDPDIHADLGLGEGRRAEDRRPHEHREHHHPAEPMTNHVPFLHGTSAHRARAGRRWPAIAFETRSRPARLPDREPRYEPAFYRRVLSRSANELRWISRLNCIL
jgi:hypothetical protein